MAIQIVSEPPVDKAPWKALEEAFPATADIAKVTLARYIVLTETHPVMAFQDGDVTGFAVVHGSEDTKQMMGWVKPASEEFQPFQVSAARVKGLPLHFKYVASRMLQAEEGAVSFKVDDYAKIARLFGFDSQPFADLQRQRIKAVLGPAVRDLQQLGAEGSKFLQAAANLLVKAEQRSFQRGYDRLRDVELAAFAHLQMTNRMKATEYSFYADPTEKGDLRREAVENYPLLKGILPNQLGMQAVVEQRQSLAQFIGQRLGVGKGVVKSLNKIRWSVQGREPGEVLDTISKIEPTWLPSTQEDWPAFLECGDTVKSILSPVLRADMKALFKGKKGNWHDYALSLRKAAGIVLDDGKPDPASIGDRALYEVSMSVSDMVASYTDKVVLPVAMVAAYGISPQPVSIAQSLQLAEASSQILFGRLNAVSSLDKLRRFHHHRLRLTGSAAEAVEFKDPTTEWPVLCENLVAPNGYHLVNLNTAADLLEEGRNLSHCVGGYAGTCAEGKSRIIGVRTPDGKYHSTAQIQGFLGENSECVQHRGYRNRQPNPDAEYAVEWFLRELQSGRIPVNTAEIHRHGEILRTWAASDNLRARAGYNWRDINAVNNAIGEWSDFAKFRNIDEMLASEHLKLCVNSLNQYSDIAYNLRKIQAMPTPTLQLAP